MRFDRAQIFRRRRAMTMAELIVGMGMTTIVLGALGAVWYSMGYAWGATGGSQNAALTGSQAVSRLENVLRQAKYIIQHSNATVAVTTKNGTKNVSTGSVFFWAADNWAGDSDGAVQIGELALLEHDTATSRIYLYQAKPYASLDAGQRSRASGVATWAELANSATPGVFKSYDFIRQTVLGEAVTSARFSVPTATANARPIVEYTLTITRPGGELALYGSTALRGPTTRPR